MSLHYGDATVRLHHGDCLDVLRDLPDASVDAVVTDPPYGLEFMGKEWDAPWKSSAENLMTTRDKSEDLSGKSSSPFIAAAVNKYQAGEPFQRWCHLWAAECLRVLKPGGHMLAFGGTRTWHRLACAIEDAGFEIRDSIAWLYGSGFPKSLDVSKAIDKAAGAEREVTRIGVRHSTSEFDPASSTDRERRAAPATLDAQTWQGWGTALKPAFEPVVVARKPLTGTVAANVLTHGTGALNVDACRIGLDGGCRRDSFGDKGENDVYGVGLDQATPAATVAGLGRWPANVALDEHQAAALDQQSGESVTPSKVTRGASLAGKDGATARSGGAMERREDVPCHGDSGGASRFFYVTREDDPCSDADDTAMTGSTTAAPSEDGASSSAALAEPPTSTSRFLYTAKAATDERVRINGTAHPTVKPLSLMRWLVRLVTPPGGTVLEPFAGSGTTVEAAILEGFRCIAIEREADYLPLITQRIHRRRDPVAAVRGSGEDAGLFDLLEEDA